MNEFSETVEKKKKILLTILTVLWILVVFQFSLHEGNSSAKMSVGVLHWVENTFSISVSGFFIRKLAHFMEYSILGILLGLTIPLYPKKMPYFFMAWFFGVGVAAIDESIQHFIPGRSGNVMDILLDSSGVLLGVSLIFIYRKIQKIRTSRLLTKHSKA